MGGTTQEGGMKFVEEVVVQVVKLWSVRPQLEQAWRNWHGDLLQARLLLK